MSDFEMNTKEERIDALLVVYTSALAVLDKLPSGRSRQLAVTYLEDSFARAVLAAGDLQSPLAKR